MWASAPTEQAAPTEPRMHRPIGAREAAPGRRPRRKTPGIEKGRLNCQPSFQTVKEPFPEESLAEFLRPQPQESNENPSFPGTCASEVTPLTQDGPTFPSGIEVHLARIPLKKVAEATFLTR